MKTLLLCLFTSLLYYSNAQYLLQYFDGSDTIPGQALFVEFDTTGIWQIGEPEKTYFDTAYTVPNVLITDTLNPLPDSTDAYFWFTYDLQNYQGGVIALQWTQKLDLDTNTEVAIIEFSTDTMQTWQNVFYHPDIDNFYGYLSSSEGTHHQTGDIGFTGTDTIWRDIWLCFGYDFIYNYNIDTLNFRYRILTDTVEHQSEGWMIDNFLVHETWFHTIGEISDEDTFTAFPTETSGPLKVVCSKKGSPLVIDHVELIDMSGRVMREYKPESTNFELDLSRFPAGQYKLKIITDQGFDVCPVIIQH